MSGVLHGLLAAVGQRQPDYSVYFDGNGDYLSVPSNSAWAMGTGAFCVELWVYPISWASSAQYVPLVRTITGSNGFAIFNHQNQLRYHTPGLGDIISTSLPPTGQWSHIAACRSGSTLSLYVNGTRAGTATMSTNLVANDLSIGGGTEWGTYHNGYISNLRIVKGSSVYDPSLTTLTVPTSRLTAVANTSLLTCQDSTFKDNSSNNFTVTANGNAAVNGFDPFEPDYSVYFDGSGDYLTVPDDAAWDFGTGDFTAECFVYPASVSSGTAVMVSHYNTSNGWWVRHVSQSLEFGYGDNSVSAVASVMTANAWQHVAVTRSGNDLKLFRNGTQVGSTVTFSTNVTGSTQPLHIGALTGSIGQWFNGYISNLRVIKGTALYTSNFTTPTAKLTAVTNTQLLTCQDSTFKDNSSNNFTVSSFGNAAVNGLDPFS